MLNRPPLWITAVAALAVVLSACSGGSTATVKTPSPAPSTTAIPTTSVSPTTGTTTAPQAPRTASVLKSALLALADLPTGYAVDPAGAGGDNGGGASSKDPKCAPFVRISNAKTAPGSKASAEVSFSGGQADPFVDESVDALVSSDAVAALQASLMTAVKACRQVTITIPGQGSSTVKVVLVSAPKFGENTVAVRMTAAGGSLEGLEITQVIAGVNDLVLSLTFVGAVADDVDGATGAAVGKAQDVLGVSAPGA